MAFTGSPQQSPDPSSDQPSDQWPHKHEDTQQTIRLTLGGHVQGVGFRPFVYRLASELGICGQVKNQIGEVEIIASGRPEQLRAFCRDLTRCAPPLAQAVIVRQEALSGMPFDSFEIVASDAQSAPHVCVPPDYFMCDDCQTELADPEDRRHNYPFINCTQCGPRYTLIESLPYDRPNTSMTEFPLCEECEAEYTSPADRRFHAEPIACPTCGPALSFVMNHEVQAGDALQNAIRELASGRIIAVKGIGGYHLMCDALQESAVARLRDRKQRPDKPLAVMFPVSGHDGLDCVRRYATPLEIEAALLISPERPIVLLAKKAGTALAANIAPGLAEIGALLPYSPLHQLLLDALERPLVATSGNISGEPVLTDNDEADKRLDRLADGFLHHNRRIVRPADDSVSRRISGSMRPLRMGRGSAPCELRTPWHQTVPTLALGGQMKVTIALSFEDRIIISPHIGEMDSPRSLATLEQLAEDLQALYSVRAKQIVCDAHPGYSTHRWAHRQNELPIASVWHHHAHASAVATEFDGRADSLVFTWDGVGLGEDGSLWGGEALFGRPGSWQRVASLRHFRLPGGERAGREPWRSAAALLWENGLPWHDCPDTSGLAMAAWRSRLNCPVTTAAGRLFDAAAALVLDRHTVSFEAAGPMQLEALCHRRRRPLALPLSKDAEGIWRSDWAPLLGMLTDQQTDATTRAELFHASVAELIVEQALAIRGERAFTSIGLSGGVFQNRFLTELVTDRLHDHGFEVRVPVRLPCNDAALCVGQAAEIAARTAEASD